MADNSRLSVINIHLDGSRSNKIEEAAKRVVIYEKVDAPSSFILTLSDMSRELADSDLLAEGVKVKISIGSNKDELVELCSGEITSLKSSFLDSGENTLIVKGFNQMHRLVKAKKTCAYAEMTDKEIIEQIAGDAGLEKDIEEVGSQHLFTVQKDQTDYDYIKAMAKKYDCKVWVEDVDDQITFCFKKLADTSEEDIVLEWGKTLLEFNPVLDSNSLLTEVEVRGWDNEKLEKVVSSKTVDDIETKIGGETLGGSIVSEKFGDHKLVIVDDTIIDTDGADTLALDVLTNNSFNYIKATGRCDGHNKIRAGIVMDINAVGGRFTGSYYVNSVKHVFTVEQGYNTFFELSRNAV